MNNGVEYTAIIRIKVSFALSKFTDLKKILKIFLTDKTNKSTEGSLHKAQIIEIRVYKQ